MCVWGAMSVAGLRYVSVIYSDFSSEGAQCLLRSKRVSFKFRFDMARWRLACPGFTAKRQCYDVFETMFNEHMAATLGSHGIDDRFQPTFAFHPPDVLCVSVLNLTTAAPEEWSAHMFKMVGQSLRGSLLDMYVTSLMRELYQSHVQSTPHKWTTPEGAKLKEYTELVWSWMQQGCPEPKPLSVAFFFREHRCIFACLTDLCLSSAAYRSFLAGNVFSTLSGESVFLDVWISRLRNPNDYAAMETLVRHTDATLHYGMLMKVISWSISNYTTSPFSDLGALLKQLSSAVSNNILGACYSTIALDMCVRRPTIALGLVQQCPVMATPIKNSDDPPHGFYMLLCRLMTLKGRNSSKALEMSRRTDLLLGIAGTPLSACIEWGTVPTLFQLLRLGFDCVYNLNFTEWRYDYTHYTARRDPLWLAVCNYHDGLQMVCALILLGFPLPSHGPPRWFISDKMSSTRHRLPKLHEKAIKAANFLQRVIDVSPRLGAPPHACFATSEQRLLAMAECPSLVSIFPFLIQHTTIQRAALWKRPTIKLRCTDLYWRHCRPSILKANLSTVFYLLLVAQRLHKTKTWARNQDIVAMISEQLFSDGLIVVSLL